MSTLNEQLKQLDEAKALMSPAQYTTLKTKVFDRFTAGSPSGPASFAAASGSSAGGAAQTDSCDVELVAGVEGDGSVLSSPSGVAIHSSGTIYLSDVTCIKTCSPDGLVKVVAGSADGESGCTLGVSSEVRFCRVSTIHFGATGTSLLICDTGNNRVVRLHTESLECVLVAGTGSAGAIDGPISVATVEQPLAAVEDGDGNVFISTGASTIRKVSAHGIVTTLAGRHGETGCRAGTGGDARLCKPLDLAYDSNAKLLYCASNFSKGAAAGDGANTAAGDAKGRHVATVTLEGDVHWLLVPLEADDVLFSLALGSSGSLFLYSSKGVYHAYPPTQNQTDWALTLISSKESLAGSRSRTAQPPPTDHLSDLLNRVALSPNGKELVVSLASGRVLKRTRQFLQDKPAAVDFPKDARLLMLVREGFSRFTVDKHIRGLRFLDKASELGFQLRDGRTALHMASGAGSLPANTGVLTVLLEHGLKEVAAAPDASGLTPLHYAAGAKHVPAAAATELLCRLLLPALGGGQSSCEASDGKGNTPLVFACGAKHPADAGCVRLLLERGANAKQVEPGPDGYSMIHLAAGARNGGNASVEAMHELFKHGAELTEQDGYGVSVLEYGCKSVDGGLSAKVASYQAPSEKAVARMITLALSSLEESLFAHSGLDGAELVRLEQLKTVALAFLKAEAEFARTDVELLQAVKQHYSTKHLAPFRIIRQRTLQGDPAFSEFSSTASRRNLICKSSSSNKEFFPAAEEGTPGGNNGQKGELCQLSGWVTGMQGQHPDGHPDGAANSAVGRFLKLPGVERNGRPVYRSVSEASEDVAGLWHSAGEAGERGKWHCGSWKTESSTIFIHSDAKSPAEAEGTWTSALAKDDQANGRPRVYPHLRYAPFELVDSMVCAAMVRSKHETLMAFIAKKTGNEEGTWAKAKPKGFCRALEKASTSAGGAAPCNFFGETVCDLLRGSLRYDSMSSMLMALQLLCALDPSLVSSDKTLPPFVPALDGAAGELAIHILDIKNRFESPTSCGWCDVIMRAYFREDPHRHVFEIQLAHAERYVKARAAHELLLQIPEAPVSLSPTEYHPGEAGAFVSGGGGAGGAGVDVGEIISSVRGEMALQMNNFKREMSAENTLLKQELASKEDAMATMRAEMQELKALVADVSAASRGQAQRSQGHQSSPPVSLIVDQQPGDPTPGSGSGSGPASLSDSSSIGRWGKQQNERMEAERRAIDKKKQEQLLDKVKPTVQGGSKLESVASPSRPFAPRPPGGEKKVSKGSIYRRP